MMKLFRLIPVLFAFLAFTGFGTSETGLLIKFNNIRNDKGYMLISLYDAPEQFPYNPKWSYRITKTDLKQQDNRYRIKMAGSGKYAIAILDDENCDMVMKKNILGIPREGFGFSNNIKPNILGAPPFDACTFTVKESVETVIEIELQYMYKESDE